jgi:LysM repeat protein
MSAPQPPPPAGAADPLSDTGYFEREPEQQLGAFDAATSTPSRLERIPPSPQMAQAQSMFEPDLAPAAAVPFAAVTTPDIPPPADSSAEPLPSAAAAAAPVPAFLAGRPSRPAPKVNIPIDRVGREDVVPSWEIDGRYGAQGPQRPRGRGGMSSLLTMVAVIVIIGLGIAAVIMVPGLLNGPGGTPRPSFSPSLTSLPPSLAATPGSSLIGVIVTPMPTTTPTSTASSSASPTPTSEPTPAATPELYRIKPGDTLGKIARKHDITVEELLAANPQITNPDHIEVGQIVVIPPPSQTPAP